MFQKRNRIDHRALPNAVTSRSSVRAYTMLGLLLTLQLLLTNMAVGQTKVSDVTVEEDPYLWLENVTDEKALDWVRQRNAKTQQHFDSDAGFIELREDLLQILDSDERIPFVSKHGEYYYNFWRDQQNERGLWRRTTLDEFRTPEPKWEILLNLDELAKAENENWVWDGASLLRPGYDLALIDLSRGGADASVTREFDLTKREFVAGGFERAEAKGGMNWIDRDQVFIYTDFGDGSMTTSGYPRIAKRWQRGTPLTAAATVYEGEVTDMYIAAHHDDSPGFERNFVSRSLAFYNNELYLLGDDSQLTKIDVPNSVDKSVFHQYLILQLREPWEVGGKSYPSGALLVTQLEAFLAGKREFDLAFEPTEHSSLASFAATRDHLLLNVLEDVKNRVYVLTKNEMGWSKMPLEGAPQFGTVSVSAVDA
ncbi:MAG: hypothetical protein ABI557_21830, partial [Aureliella sp.]